MQALVDALKKGPMPSTTAEDDMNGASDDEGSEDYQTAGQEVMDAMKAGDAKAFTTALKAFVDLCMSK